MQVAVVALVIAASGSAATKTAASATTVATATSLDYRVVVTAHKNSSGNAPTAEVNVATYTRNNNGEPLPLSRE